MPALLRAPLLPLLCAFAALPLTLRADPATAPSTLAAPLVGLDIPADQVLTLTLFAKGAQIYECRALPNDPAKYEWAFKAPEADLFDGHGNQLGRHFAGPTWELTDGGKVVGKLQAKADAPDGKGIPWLLLSATQATGPKLGKVLTIRRIETIGGKPPAEPADQPHAGQERRVPYTATYQFFVAKP